MNKARKILMEKEMVVDIYEYLESKAKHYEEDKKYYQESVDSWIAENPEENPKIVTTTTAWKWLLKIFLSATA